MHVKIDVSEHLRYIERDSILAVATDDGKYRKNVCLFPRVKKRINHYSGKIDIIHSIMVYYLIRDDLTKYSSITICCDVSKNKLRNNLAKLFKDNKTWKSLEKTKNISIKPVNKKYVHYYANDVRKGREEKGEEIRLDLIREKLYLFKE
jgi:hypothetical protein